MTDKVSWTKEAVLEDCKEALQTSEEKKEWQTRKLADLLNKWPELRGKE
ncbi:MAG: hypothetical protein Q4G58_13445 [bacterium]|nr:hypothetical protein [bacterium]